MIAQEKMRALRLVQVGRLEEQILPVPRPASDEVLVRTVLTTICTSDLNDISNNTFGVRLPRILGHEGTGIVVATGSKVRQFQENDRVATHPVIPCLSCENCSRGLGHLCTRMSHLGLDRDGTFAEYYCIREDRVRRIDSRVPWESGVLLEPVAVCMEAVNRGRIQTGESVLIVGDGPFGLIMATLARHRGAAKIVVVGRHPFRLGKIPFATTINEHAAADVAGDILDANNGKGFDAAIQAAGTQSAVDLCLKSLRARGRTVIFSAIEGPVTVDLFSLHIRELEILGACNDEDLIDQAAECISDSQYNFADLVTHTIPIAAWPKAFELARRGKDEAIKVALSFGFKP